MQKEFASRIGRMFKDNSLGLGVYLREHAGEEFLASMVDEANRIEMWLRFRREKESFALIFVFPASSEDWVDLFRYSPDGKVDSAFWIDTRFLDSVYSSIGDAGFELCGPSVVQVSATIARSGKSIDVVARKLGFSKEKACRFRDGYYIDNPNEVTQALLRSLPEWSTLVSVSRPTAQDAIEATSRFSSALEVVFSRGLPEFKSRLERLGVLSSATQ